MLAGSVGSHFVISPETSNNMASEVGLRGILKNKTAKPWTSREPEPAAEVKNITFSNIYIYHGPINDYDKALLRPTRKLTKKCEMCRRIVSLDIDLYKATLMPVNPECKENTRFHLDMFKRADEDEYDDLISELNFDVRCKKHETCLEYRDLL